MKTLNPALVLTFLFASELFLTPRAQANLILNGSFESPGISGTSGFGSGRQQYSAPSVALTNWTVAGSGDVFLHKSPDIGNDAGPSFNFAQDGNFYLDLSGSYQNSAHAIVFQDFATIPLTTYELSFYIGASGQTPPAAIINVQLTGATTLLNTTLIPLAPSTNINWSLQTFSFVADSPTTRLSFTDLSTSDENASFVDNVSVVSAVGGSVVGMSPTTGKVTCQNLTTKEMVKITLPADVLSWDCEQAGLIVNPGDQIKQTITVIGPAD